MKYQLRRFGQNAAIEITAKEYEEIKSAGDGLVETVEAEEKFDVLMENYAEFESTLFAAKLSDLTFSNYHNVDKRKLLRLISRRLLNLLASCRLYRDILKQPDKVFFWDKGTLDKWLGAHTCEEAFVWLLMDNIRNYAQHRDLTVHMLSIGSEWKDDPLGERAAYSITPQFNPKALIEDTRCRSVELKSKLQHMNNPVELTPYVRKYVEMIGLLHVDLRKHAEADLNGWKRTIKNALQPDEKVLGIVVTSSAGQEFEIAKDLVPYHEYLKGKNRSTVNLSKRYVEW
jgi:hypothetical protein